ncbi:MAG: anthranilate synthase component I family protein, partial [Pyrinomonadaceae bacterium]
MSNFSYSAEVLQINADDKTPVGLYANLRQIFPETLLLECVEARSLETAASYICADPIARFSIKNGAAVIEQKGRKIAETKLNTPENLTTAFNEFQNNIEIENRSSTQDLTGLFGYVGFSAIPFLEDITFFKAPPVGESIPALQFALYRYVLRFDHYRHTLTAVQLHDSDQTALNLNELLTKITMRRAIEFPFKSNGSELSEMSDADFAEKVKICQHHIQRGDVFQIVPSRKFVQNYSGDEFQVYRALRRINPSPFLFFYDYGAFSLFGSSPEAQLIVKNNVATLHPIAGTYPRGVDEAEDRQFASNLQNDAKETAEHTMLVDLARNDLGRHCRQIHVEKFKQTELYSHVIHLVSKVTGKLNDRINAFRVLADTFPAGTLSGAPKYRAMQILNKIEPSARSFYGGSVGFFGLDGSCTQAIMIRSFLAKNRKLVFQAGAGIVADSVPETETAEVRNKLAALRRAIEAAE